ncbi:MAG: GspH/FimT family pseudopilin [Acidobacteriota bacterium]|nr:GspH/FimT family pseudopilin [Acidobacteriota bacterium]
MVPVRKQRLTAGFTLIEILVVLALLMIVMLFSFPALNQMIHRAKLVGAARETQSMMRLARLESIKRGVKSYVVFDCTGSQVYVWTDMNNNGALDSGEIIGTMPLPNNITFWGPADVGACGTNSIVGFTKITVPTTGAQLIFNPDGSADNLGDIRFSDQKGGPSANFVEAAVETLATGRTAIRKYQPVGGVGPGNWNLQDQGWTW